MKVAITGMGIISAIGNSVEENFDALVNGRKAITDIDNIGTVHANKIKVGEIKKTNEELASELGLSADNNYSRTAMIGAIAAKQAVQNAGISDIKDYKTGLISATSVGGMDTTERHYYDYFNDPNLVKYISAHDGGDVAQKIAETIGLKGFVTTFVCGQFDHAGRTID